ncbi:hypothetical protein NPIL_515941 [Nephila pilipes]|uniref:Uncharacterized protein n=1 Tax=Nephila pilipes TaxID=299642 RepID=A0A8X6NJN4_NEPPI|nr:hypothetical protein NPIL_515941 [Nephila pilipes]
MGQTVEDFIDSNAMFLMYDPEHPNTFIHNSGSSTNPDLTMITTNIADQCIKTVIGDPGSGHRITKLIVELKTKLKREELQKAIGDLEQRKLPGGDNIFPDFLKHLGQTAGEKLLKIYNQF